MDEILKEARAEVSNSDNIVILSGAGMSAESGVPTFRGEDGLWKNYRAEELATPEAFNDDPEVVWEWYDWRRGLIKPLKPNPGHYAIAELEIKKKNLSIVTQNVDGLHREAGSKKVYELHGNIWKVRCIDCGRETDNHDTPIKILPKCKECEGVLRPGVVWFGESLDPYILSKASELLSHAELTIVVGTSGLVQPAASMAMLAKDNGSKIIEINIEETPNHGLVDFFLLGKSGEILPELIED